MERTCRAARLDFKATRVLLLLAVGAGIPVVSAPRGLPLSLEGVRDPLTYGVAMLYTLMHVDGVSCLDDHV